MAINLENIEWIIAAGVALWAATNTIVTGAKVINERRDAVITGYLGDRQLDLDHRRIIMFNDWLPMALAVGLLCTGIGIFVLIVPGLVQAPPWYLWVATCTVGAAFLISAVSWLAGGLLEYKLMKRALK